MNITKSILFSIAHAEAKKVHQKGDNYSVTFGEALKIVYKRIKDLGAKVVSKSKSVIPVKQANKTSTKKGLVLSGLREALRDDGSFKKGDDVSMYNVTFMQLREITGLSGNLQMQTLRELKNEGVVSIERVRHGFNIFLLEPY